MVEISEVRDPVVVPRSSGGAPRSPFAKALHDLPIGRAVIVSGLSDNNISSMACIIGRRYDPPRKFSRAKLPDGSVQIVRIA